MASAASLTSLSILPPLPPLPPPPGRHRESFNTHFLYRSPPPGLGFSAAADLLLSVHVASKLRSLKAIGKPIRVVATMAKKIVGNLTEAKLKGKRVFVRADLNVPLNNSQEITDDTRIAQFCDRIAVLTENKVVGGAKNGDRLGGAVIAYLIVFPI